MSSIAENAHIVYRSLINSHTFKTFTDTKVTYMFNPNTGTYNGGADDLIDLTAEVTIGDDCSDRLKSEVKSIIKSYTKVDRDDFDSSDNMIVVSNGLLDVSARKLLPFSPDHLALRSLATAFDKDADCPTIKKFLTDNLTPEDNKNFRKFLGFLLMPDVRYKKALVFVGPRDTGKTTLITLLTALLGQRNVSMESIQDLCDTRWGTNKLEGKIANIRDDMSAVSTHNVGMFKELTGNYGMARGENKGEDIHYFKMRAKMIFACNLLPPAKSADAAYYGRWIIIEMRKRYSSGKNSPRGRKADTYLLGKMLNELPGLLNMALAGRLELIDDNGFDDLDDNVACMRYLAYAGDSIGRFFSDAVLISPDNVISKSELYGDYHVYCNLRNAAAKSENEFSPAVKAVFPGVVECYIGRRERAWRGIAVKSKTEIAHKIALGSYPISLKPSDAEEFNDEDGS